jgi:diguanylate cyclase (GGDEF)-like protein/PAS domain S-box-containing protein
MSALPPGPLPSGTQPKSFAAALLELDPGTSLARALRLRVIVGTVILVAVEIAHDWAERAGLIGARSGAFAFGAVVVALFVLIAFETTRAVRTADERRRSLEASYRRLVEQLPLVLYVDQISENSANIYTSPQVEPLLGYTVEEWVSDPDLFVKALHDEDRERVLAEHKYSHENRIPLTSEYRLVAKDGRVVWLRDEGTLFEGEDGRLVHMQGYLLDITPRRQAEEELRALAVTDPLTSLPNRRQLLERLRAAEADGRPQSLLFLDIDDFKTFNDSLGHRAGDELLVAIGDRISECLTDGELVVRLGGDEFAVWTAATATRDLEQLARRLLGALGASFHVSGRELRVRASVGIATGTVEDELLRNADLAMYEAKGRGSDGYAFFEHRLHEATERRLRLSADLRQAARRQELHVAYQPTVDLRRGTVEGLEALMRWSHPRLGHVSPAEFIPVAEEHGSIVELGQFVLDVACRHAVLWMRRNRPFSLGVNVSGRQLLEPSFPAAVIAVLDKYGLEPSLLRLELTESVLVEANPAARANVAAVREVGVKLAVDDFGTGNSWIAHLRDFSPDLIKIDRSLLAGLDTGDERLLRGTVALARELGVQVVAEGVERSSELRVVRALGCEIGQGFLLGKPMSAAEIGVLLERELRSDSVPARLHLA